MPPSVLPLHLQFTPIRLLFQRSTHCNEQAVGEFMKHIEQAYESGDMPNADFHTLKDTVKHCLTSHRYSVKALESLEEWQRNAFAMQLGQALLKTADSKQMYEIEVHTDRLTKALGIGAHARGWLARPTPTLAEKSMPKPSAQIVSFADYVSSRAAASKKIVGRA